MSRKIILFIGHDMKFVRLIVNHFSRKEEYEVKTFTYSGHNIRDYQTLAQILPNVDLIFCEWGLGNLNWLSKNKFVDQKLIVRVHAQEFNTEYLKSAAWSEVDKVIFVGPHKLKRFQEIFPEHGSKTRLIYNVIDNQDFDLNKFAEAQFNIGMLGVLPKSKAPHTGLEILTLLRESDNRFKFFIKSKKPSELDWLMKREEEISYYKEFEQLLSDNHLQDSIIWESHGEDVSKWFKKIGFILSPSEHESFHMAIPEGMASGAIPVIRNWEGADQIYPTRFIFKDIAQAAAIILKYQDDAKRNAEAAKLKTWSKQQFGLKVILGQYERLFNEVLENQQIIHTSPQLRNIYDQLQKEQTHTIELLTSREIQALEAISEFKKQVAEKDKQMAKLLEEEETHLQAIKDLNTEIGARNCKVDEIISIADEMKLQLAEGRLREKEKDKQLESLNRKIHELNDMIITLNRDKTKNEEDVRELQQTINSLSHEKELATQLIGEKNNKITVCEVQFAEKEKEITSIKQNLTRMDFLLVQSHELQQSLRNELESWKEKSTDYQKQLMALQTKAHQQEALIKNLTNQSREQDQYIKYLESRFLNKMIGIVRKRLKNK